MKESCKGGGDARLVDGAHVEGRGDKLDLHNAWAPNHNREHMRAVTEPVKMAGTRTEGM